MSGRTQGERSCSLQRAKPAYDRDGDMNEIYAIACGGSIFTFIRTSAGFQLTDVGPCLGQ